ncbi:MAG TPA: hypothetical protein VF818_00290 [Ktedonobacterales bacterium]
MMYVYADVAAQVIPRAWQTIIIGPLTFLIYGILGPALYLLILIIGAELAWPGGTRLRQLIRNLTGMRVTSPTLGSVSTTHILCVVGGFIAVAVWSAAVTTWLAGYLHSIPAPQLSMAQASTPHVAVFVITLLIGMALGYVWVDGMRRAATGNAYLAMIAIPMSTSGTLLFFYAMEPGVRDILLVLALGIFGGELAAVARHPTLMREGMVAELLSVPPSQLTLVEEAIIPAEDDDADDDAHNGWRGRRRNSRVSEEPSHTLVGIHVPAAPPDTSAEQSTLAVDSPNDQAKRGGQ